MNMHPVSADEPWIAARQELLEKEKEFSRLRDELTEMRQALPWRKIEKDYRFTGPSGGQSLADLFDSCSQLIIYHFMYGPDWPQPCKACSMVADHYDPILIHLRQRDVAFATVSRAPIENILAYRDRMGWSFPWVSSLDSEFNEDFYVSFTQQQLDAGDAYYNYRNEQDFTLTEAPGISAFIRAGDGQIFHTYSSYARGLEEFLGVYRLLDIVAKGRDESALPFPMDWVRQKDRYQSAAEGS